jgi:hypothetical protein
LSLILSKLKLGLIRMEENTYSLMILVFNNMICLIVSKNPIHIPNHDPPDIV